MDSSTHNSSTHPRGTWDATMFFEHLCATNRLAQSEGFTFCQVSGLEGFEEAVAQMQSVNNFVCVSDIADGYTEINNTPRTRRVKTIFLAMRHGAEDMDARSECMEIMRELFRQFMSRLILEKVKLEQNCIYLDPRISFNEIDRYFFSGCAGAYFQIAVDCYTDLRHKVDEWSEDYNADPYIYIPYYDVYLLGYDTDFKLKSIKQVQDLTGCGLAESKNIIEGEMPYLLFRHIPIEERAKMKEKLDTYAYLKTTIVIGGKIPSI